MLNLVLFLIVISLLLDIYKKVKSIIFEEIFDVLGYIYEFFFGE
jgi:hypothetical protein